MGDELKAGALLLSFCFIVSGYFVNNGKYKFIGLILLFFFVLTIFKYRGQQSRLHVNYEAGSRC